MILTFFERQFQPSKHLTEERSFKKVILRWGKHQRKRTD